MIPGRRPEDQAGCRADGRRSTGRASQVRALCFFRESRQTGRRSTRGQRDRLRPSKALGPSSGSPARFLSTCRSPALRCRHLDRDSLGEPWTTWIEGTIRRFPFRSPPPCNVLACRSSLEDLHLQAGALLLEEPQPLLARDVERRELSFSVQLSRAPAFFAPSLLCSAGRK